MSNDEGMSKSEDEKARVLPNCSGFVIRISFDIRHSSFVIIA